MSLFPAYSELCGGTSSDKIQDPQSTNKDNSEPVWLENPSFDRDELRKIPEPASDEPAPPAIVQVIEKRKLKKDHKSKKSKKHKSDRNKIAVLQPQASTSIAISGSDEFYLDKTAIRGFLSVQTLYKPACPRYHTFMRGFTCKFYKSSKPFKRYHAVFKKSKESGSRTLEQINQDDERFRKALYDDPTNVSKWIEYYNFRIDNPVEFEKYQNDKIQFEILEKAMKHNSKEDKILKLYLSAAKKVYPNDKVLELIDGLIDKDPNNFLLWKELIYSHQSSMAQCIVPDILKIFEKSMRSLFTMKDDIIMLNLYKYCALFLRQCGLMEQFFGLIHLTLNLNITTKQFPSTFYSEEHNNTLVEYEELVLKSGLPMNEIWLRIEKLRSAFNFLPVHSNRTSSDPQRILINEEICVYVYPLINKAYTFDLFILVLKLLKFPFACNAYKSLSIFQNEEMHEMDDVEVLFPAFVHLNLDKSDDGKNEIAFSILCNLIKELNSLPSYLQTTNLASEAYYCVLLDILIFCCDCFTNTRQNVVLLLFWMRLELILVKIEKLTNEKNEVSSEQKKKIRSRIKKTLKKTKFQNNRNFYAEYAVLEYFLETDDGFVAAEKVFMLTMRQQYLADDESEADLYNLCVKYTEIAIREQAYDKGLSVLISLVFNELDQLNFESVVKDIRKMLALQRLTETLKSRVEKCKDDSLLELEDVFHPNLLINTVKAKLYLLLLMKKPKSLIYDEIEYLMKIFVENNPFHKFVREKLFEMYFQFIRFKCTSLMPTLSSVDNNVVVGRLLTKWVKEYPQNVSALSYCAFSESLTWFRIRSLLANDTIISPVSTIFLIASARYRFSRALLDQSKSLAEPAFSSSSNIEISESTYKIRIVNLLKLTIERNPSRIAENVLIWRLYLRALFDDNFDSSLGKCKNVLYSALEVCPWYKVLYLDGAFFSPQLLSELLDIIIEKSLRIHALPEELEILRND